MSKQPPNNKNRPPLSRKQILLTAMKLADQQGIQALSMRKLGKAVGVEAMSLYNHVANKDDLLDGMIELVCAEIKEPSPGENWREAIRLRSQSFYQVLLRHPWASVLMESRVSPNPTRLRHHNAVIGVLREAGFSIGITQKIFLTLDSYIYGFVLQETSWSFQESDIPDVIQDITPSIDVDAYPYLMEMMLYTSASATQQNPSIFSFDFGLDLLLEAFDKYPKDS